MAAAHYYTRITGVTTEQLISSRPCCIQAIIPEATSLGTITIRDSATAAAATPMHIAAIGLTQQGKTFGTDGVRTSLGLTVQPSSASDSVLVCWAPL